MLKTQLALACQTSRSPLLRQQSATRQHHGVWSPLLYAVAAHSVADGTHCQLFRFVAATGLRCDRRRVRACNFFVLLAAVRTGISTVR